MTTVDRIMELADAYADAHAMYRCKYVENAPAEQFIKATQRTVEARAALLTAVKELTAERDEYQVAADKLAGEIKDMQRQEPVAAVLEVRRVDGPWQRYDVYSALTVAEDTKRRVEGDGIEARVIPLYAAPQPAKEPKP